MLDLEGISVQSITIIVKWIKHRREKGLLKLWIIYMCVTLLTTSQRVALWFHILKLLCHVN